MLTLLVAGLKIYVNHCEKRKKNCLSDRSYRNKKSHEIWGYLEANLMVLQLIFGRGVLSTPTSNRVKLNKSENKQGKNEQQIFKTNAFINSKNKNFKIESNDRF